jgi:hypothetical protein
MRLYAILASLGLALTATAAFATVMSASSVKLVTPVTTPNTAIIALNTGWSCTGDTCTAMLDRKAPAVRDCRQIVRAVGPVAAFTVGTKSLDEAGIAACNAPAR